MKHIQNNQKTMENPYWPIDFKISRKIPQTQVLETFAKCSWFPKRKPNPWIWIKTSIENLYSLDYSVLFFVIPISAQYKI